LVEVPVKHGLIEIGSKMLMANTVMDADELSFEVGKDEMDDRQIVLGNFWVAALGNGIVCIPGLAADTIFIGPHHTFAKPVANTKGRFIARQAKLSLKLSGLDTGRLNGNQ
jgi:hypothetical protein